MTSSRKAHSRKPDSAVIPKKSRDGDSSASTHRDTGVAGSLCLNVGEFRDPDNFLRAGTESPSVLGRLLRPRYK